MGDKPGLFQTSGSIVRREDGPGIRVMRFGNRARPCRDPMTALPPVTAGHCETGLSLLLSEVQTVPRL